MVVGRGVGGGLAGRRRLRGWFGIIGALLVEGTKRTMTPRKRLSLEPVWKSGMMPFARDRQAVDIVGRILRIGADTEVHASSPGRTTVACSPAISMVARFGVGVHRHSIPPGPVSRWTSSRAIRSDRSGAGAAASSKSAREARCRHGTHRAPRTVAFAVVGVVVQEIRQHRRRAASGCRLRDGCR